MVTTLDTFLEFSKEQRPLRKTSCGSCNETRANRDNQAWAILAKKKGKSISECKTDQEKRLNGKKGGKR